MPARLGSLWPSSSPAHAPRAPGAGGVPVQRRWRAKMMGCAAAAKRRMWSPVGPEAKRGCALRGWPDCGRAYRAAARRLLAAALGTVACATAEAGPSPEEYVAHVGGEAKLVCGKRPTVLDTQLDDYGAAYPGFLILNPKLLAKVSTPVKLWIHAHECGHQYRGPDEETADCFAVQRGRRQ